MKEEKKYIEKMEKQKNSKMVYTFKPKCMNLHQM